jgi:hypothetical protein
VQKGNGVNDDEGNTLVRCACRWLRLLHRESRPAVITLAIVLAVAEGFFLGIAFTLFKHTRPVFRSMERMEDTAAGAFMIACVIAIPALILIWRAPSCFTGS